MIWNNQGTLAVGLGGWELEPVDGPFHQNIFSSFLLQNNRARDTEIQEGCIFYLFDIKDAKIYRLIMF